MSTPHAKVRRDVVQCLFIYLVLSVHLQVLMAGICYVVLILGCESNLRVIVRRDVIFALYCHGLFQWVG